MNKEDVKKGLDQIRLNFHRILAPDATLILEQAKARVDSSKDKYDAFSRRTDDPNLEPQPWGYAIYPERPLRFALDETPEGFDAQVEVYCTVLWKEENQPPVHQEIHLCVWNAGNAFRADVDHPDIENRILENISRGLNGRVMLRCHFDRANAGQAGPVYHMQIGGNSRADEICWIPEAIKLPRITYPPMDLILICQMIAYNFFPDEYRKIMKDGMWKNSIRNSQNTLLREYYSDCLNVIDQEEALLDHLWNTK